MSDTHFYPLKIALTFSGETRTFNSMHGTPDGLTRMIEQFREAGHVIDIYGHTWDYCEMPQESEVIKFTNLKISNKQTEITDWVEEDLLTRAVIYRRERPELLELIEKYQFPELTLQNADVMPSEIREFLIDSSVKSHSQFFSFCLAAEDIDWATDYDVIIRARWDITINKNGLMDYVIDYQSDNEFWIKYLGQLLVMFDRGINEEPICANLLLTGNSWIFFDRNEKIPYESEECSEDTFFALRLAAANPFVDALKNKTWRDNIEIPLASLPISSRSCSHGLWSNQWKYYNMIGYYGIPSMFVLNRS